VEEQFTPTRLKLFQTMAGEGRLRKFRACSSRAVAEFISPESEKTCCAVAIPVPYDRDVLANIIWCSTGLA